MSAKVTNDVKGKHHSFEATIELTGKGPDNGRWYFTSRAYGKSAEDSMFELIKTLQDSLKHIQQELEL